jgi:hypothetical protein
MIRVLQLLLAFVFVFMLNPKISFGQDDDCCPEEDKYGREDELLSSEWEKQMLDLNGRKTALLGALALINKDIDNLKNQSSDLDKQLSDAENGLYSSVGMNKNTMADFRKKFDETEKKINNKLGTCEDAKKLYFNEIEASKAKCLPEFNARYLAMKSKLDAWCKESGKSGQYTVVKGDCLWRIAGKSEIYSNNNYWPKLWEANEEGVASAPPHTPKKVTNPNLIYPGQVLKVPSLNDEDLKKLNSITYVMKTQKAANDFKKEKNNKSKNKTVKTNTTSKDVKLDKKVQKKEVKKDDKKPDIKK